MCDKAAFQAVPAAGSQGLNVLHLPTSCRLILLFQQTGKILIGDGVTIYAGAIILGPVEVGSNAIIGAGAIVTKDVPPCTVVTGVDVQR